MFSPRLRGSTGSGAPGGSRKVAALTWLNPELSRGRAGGRSPSHLRGGAGREVAVLNPRRKERTPVLCAALHHTGRLSLCGEAAERDGATRAAKEEVGLRHEDDTVIHVKPSIRRT